MNLEDRMKVLEMIEQGKITAADGLELLKALDETTTVSTSSAAGTADRFLRVRVNGDKAKVNVNIPLALIKVATKFVGVGTGFIPERAREEMNKQGIDLSKLDLDELVQLMDQGLVDGKLVDVEADDEKDGHVKVEVYVE
ncbi:MAG: SHOCT-like domain-containing protein [Methylocystaceae bacterium]